MASSFGGVISAPDSKDTIFPRPMMSMRRHAPGTAARPLHLLGCLRARLPAGRREVQAAGKRTALSAGRDAFGRLQMLGASSVDLG